jgi:hypothetical protein
VYVLSKIRLHDELYTVMAILSKGILFTTWFFTHYNWISRYKLMDKSISAVIHHLLIILIIWGINMMNLSSLNDDEFASPWLSHVITNISTSKVYGSTEVMLVQNWSRFPYCYLLLL